MVAALQEQGGGWQLSGGGKAGRGRKGGRADRTAAKTHTATTGLASNPCPGSQKHQPEAGDWLCEVCDETNWRMRKVCRFCRCPRGGLASALAAAPAAGANATPLGAPSCAAAAASQRAAATAVASSGGGAPSLAPAQEQLPTGPVPAGAPRESPPARPTRKEAAVARAAEAAKLAKLDAALEALAGDEAAEAARQALQHERSRAATRMAETKPLGSRVATARKAHERAKAALAAAEERARAAAEAAQRALEAEHQAAVELAELERQVAAQQGVPAVQAEDVSAFLTVIDDWLMEAGVTPPAEVAAAAEALRVAAQPTGTEGGGDEEVDSPTDCEAAMSPSTAGDADAAPDAPGDERRGEVRLVAPGGLEPAATRVRRSGPYSRSASR